tara:strand:+ start:2851 stop:4734 length:1884 start_codon:yes stop_codon:yes gene_type:complete
MENLDGQLSRSMVNQYAPVYRTLTKDVEDLIQLAQTQNLKPWQVMRMKRLRDLEAQFLNLMSNFATAGGDLITDGQRQAVGLARNGATQAVSAGLPEGITMDNLANVGLEWNRLPDDAFSNFVGISADGQPIGNLLEPLGPDAASEIKKEIRSGIALGKGPRDTAKLIETAAGMPLTRALLITRTETNRAFREATRLEYASSPVVKGYRRMAAKQDRTCMACIALDGTLYDLNQPLDEHPNGRCALVPEVLDYADLGLDVERQTPPEDARTWFAGQDEELQRTILGPDRLRAYKAGELDLSQLYQRKSHPVWGDTAVINPMKNITLKSGTQLDEWVEFDKIVQPDRVKRKIKPPKVVSKVVTPAKNRFDDAGRTLNTMKNPEQVPELDPPKIEATAEEIANMTPGEYEQALLDLKPETDKRIAERDAVFAKNMELVEENRATLRQTPGGEELDGAIQAWASGGNENMRVGARKWMQGDEALTRGSPGQETGATLAEAVSNGEQFNQPLYRGVRVYDQQIDKMEDIYSQGKIYDAHISSFSTDTKLAESFSGSGSMSKDTSIVFNLESGSRGLNIESVSTAFGEKERIIAGRFEVISTSRVQTGSGRRAGEVLHVNIRQINTLVKEAE